MANNYLQFSAFLQVPANKMDLARILIKRETGRLYENDDDGYCGYCGTLAHMEEKGVWFHEEESGTPEHVEMIARALVEELNIDEPFVCSWACTCSKPRIDEFGGGAFLIRRGKPTIWCDAERQVRLLDERRTQRHLKGKGRKGAQICSADHNQPLPHTKEHLCIF